MPLEDPARGLPTQLMEVRQPLRGWGGVYLYRIQVGAFRDQKKTVPLAR